MTSDAYIRSARFMDAWYPQKPQALQDLLEKTQEKLVPDAEAPNQPGAKVCGLLLPHAGLEYSARGQLCGFRHAETILGSPPKTVLILAPSHYQVLENASLYSAGFEALETPLGLLEHIPLDLPFNDEALAGEHALEMFLPVLAFLWPQCRVRLCLCGPANSYKTLEEMAEKLPQNNDFPLLVLASSDMSHFGPRYEDYPRHCRQMSLKEQEAWVLARDRTALLYLKEDPHIFFSRRRDYAPSMCGSIASLLALEYLKKISPDRRELKILDQYSSLILDSKDQSFVSYAAVDLGA